MQVTGSGTECHHEGAQAWATTIQPPFARSNTILLPQVQIVGGLWLHAFEFAVEHARRLPQHVALHMNAGRNRPLALAVEAPTEKMLFPAGHFPVKTKIIIAVAVGIPIAMREAAR
eukprot:224130-Rhodomonas_salina.1